MNILYDYQAFYFQKYGGISRYIINLYNGINRGATGHASIALFYSDNYFANTAIPSSSYSWKKRKLGNRMNKINKWNKKYTKLTLPFRNFDIFHPTYYDPYFVNLTKKPVVITVHDMIHEKFPGYFNDAEIVTQQKKESLKRADAVIAISRSTYNDLITLFDIDRSKVSLVYHGVDVERLMNIPLLSNSIHPNKNYILFVGERWSYKNFKNFTEAVAPILNKNPELDLVCAGGREFSGEEQAFFKKHKITSQCHQYTVNDTGLHDLYRNALCFVFPSEYEGFGFPILEAFAAGCPVVLSNTSSFAEVGGGAALYFDPYDMHAMNMQITKIIEDEALRANLKNKGAAQLQSFPFNKCLAETMSVYRQLL